MRHQRPKRRKIGKWPSELTPAELAGRVRYIGSAEHKDHPSPAGPPRLRSDATRCDVSMTRDVAGNTEALREGIRRMCVSAEAEDGFPKYVWTRIAGHIFEARHINGPSGTYKGYRLEPVEWPDDPENRLKWQQP